MHKVRVATITAALAGLGATPILALPAAHADNGDVPTDITYQTLTEDVYDPMGVQVAPDGRVIVAQRDGKIRVWHQDGKIVTAGQVPVNAARGCGTCAEKVNDDGGIYGMVLDRHFEKTGKVYLWYDRAHSGNPKTNLETWRLSTVVLTRNDKISLKSEKVLFKAKAWYLDPEGSQAHYGGVLEWLPDGTLLLGTGDETDPKSSGGYGPRDNTKQKGYYWNAELTAQNPASPWGKILRFNPDGSVPDGSKPGVKPNPFIGKKLVNPYIPDGTNHVMHYYPWGHKFTPKPIKFNPYVWAMGFKQPWRGSVDPKSGHLFIGEVGPDASSEDSQKGPEGYEEQDIIVAGGNYGWPRCIGPNLPYHNYDWDKQVDRGVLSCKGMTGAYMWYTGGNGFDWEGYVGFGPKTSEFLSYYAKNQGSLRLPDRFNDNVVFADWSRNWLYGLPVANGKPERDPAQWNVIKPPTLPGTFVGIGKGGVVPTQADTFATMLAAMDGDVGRDGAFYFVEYGGGYGNNPLSRLSRIACTGCSSNPAKDFVHVKGVPVVSAADAVQPQQTQPVATQPAADSGLVSAPVVGAASLVLLLGGLGWRRRRHVPC